VLGIDVVTELLSIATGKCQRQRYKVVRTPDWATRRGKSAVFNVNCGAPFTLILSRVRENLVYQMVDTSQLTFAPPRRCMIATIKIVNAPPTIVATSSPNGRFIPVIMRFAGRKLESL
jgi:hypothetical protein